MEYTRFPSRRPNEEITLNKANTILAEPYRVSHKPASGISRVDADPISVERVSFKQDGGETIKEVISGISPVYKNHLRRFLYHLSILALLLGLDNELQRVKPYVFWATLAQNFEYSHGIFLSFIDEIRRSTGVVSPSSGRSDTFERYLVTEYLVCRHEPVFVYRYRRLRKPSWPNISQAALDDIVNDVHRYARLLEMKYRCWSGVEYDYTFHPVKAKHDMEFTGQLLVEAKEWYKDYNRPRILSCNHRFVLV
ncbi:hypothetical protein V8B97DRAFT_890733 [Scleroderma yunnanense]